MLSMPSIPAILLSYDSGRSTNKLTADWTQSRSFAADAVAPAIPDTIACRMEISRTARVTEPTVMVDRTLWASR